MNHPLNPTNKQIIITIPNNTHYNKTITLLTTHQLIPQILKKSNKTWLFTIQTHLHDHQIPLKTNLYHFNHTMNPNEIINHLTHKTNTPLLTKKNQITIIPKHNIFQINKLLQQINFQKNITQYPQTLMNLNIENVPLPLQKTPQSHTNLKNYLFPNTYTINIKKKSNHKIVQQILKRFQNI